MNTTTGVQTKELFCLGRLEKLHRVATLSTGPEASLDSNEAKQKQKPVNILREQHKQM
jgi:hypothetical protein